MTTAVLVATAAAGPGRVAADLPLDGVYGAKTPGARLAAQLADEGVAVRVLSRPGAAGDGVLTAVDEAADLDALADVLADAPAGPVLLADADVVTQASLLRIVLADPRGSVTALVGPAQDGAPWPVRVPGPVVTDAASPFHPLVDPTSRSLGVLRVPAAARERAARLARAAARDLREAAPAREPGGPEDALALLLVALVRDGVRVSPVPVRGFAWARPDSPDGADAAVRRLEEVDEEQARVDAAVKPDDGFFGTFFVSPYSRYLARMASRAGLSPNAVTVTSMVLGAVAAALFAVGGRLELVLGAVVLHAAFTLDCVDGQLARYAGAFSALGAYLDAVFDRVKEYLVYAGLAVGAARHGHDVWGLAALALTLQTTHHAVLFSWPGGDQPGVVPRTGPFLGPRGAGAAAAAGGARARAGQVAAAVSAGTNARSVTKWAKRMVLFPIGERFAVLTLGAALGGPRLVFPVFLAWVTLALAWSTTGRVLRSVAR